MSGKYQTLVISERSPGVTQVTMSRPAVFNAFDEVMISELDAVFTELSSDPKVRIIVLAGEGKHFSAGADLQWMQRASEASFDWNIEDARRFASMLYKISSCPKPTVARVQGAALGGGVGLTCACDMAVASDHASFAVSEAKFGILPSVIGPHVVNAVGKRNARYLALTTSRVNAQTALQMGMVQAVVSLADLDSEVDRIVKDLLAGGPSAQHEIKILMDQLSVAPISPEVRELTAKTIARVRGTNEAREGFSAFLQKRSPNWIPE